MMYGWGWNGGWDGGGIGWPGMIMMMVFWIAVLVGIVALVVWLLRQAQGRAANAGPGPEGPAAGETPLDILKKRYARGEIDKTEFEEKKKDITG